MSPISLHFVFGIELHGIKAHCQICIESQLALVCNRMHGSFVSAYPSVMPPSFFDRICNKTFSLFPILFYLNPPPSLTATVEVWFAYLNLSKNESILGRTSLNGILGSSQLIG